MRKTPELQRLPGSDKIGPIKRLIDMGMNRVDMGINREVWKALDIDYSSIEKSLIGRVVHDEIELYFSNPPNLIELPMITSHPLFKRSGINGEYLWDLSGKNIWILEHSLVRASIACMWDVNPTFISLNRGGVKVECPVDIIKGKLIMTVRIRSVDGIWGENSDSVEHCLIEVLQRRFETYSEVESFPNEARFEVVLDDTLIRNREQEFWFRTMMRAYIGFYLQCRDEDPPVIARGEAGLSLTVTNVDGPPKFLRRLKIPRGRTVTKVDGSRSVVLYARRDLELLDRACSRGGGGVVTSLHSPL